MPTTRCLLLTLSLLLLLTLVAPPATAIVIRHDRDDASYLELGQRFPAAVTVRPDGAGVLIAPDWVLTAAHVARGAAGRSPRVEVGGRDYQVSRIFVHPDWTEMGPHDVGLLRLAEPVSGIDPVALYAADDEVGRVVTFVGRGDTGTGLTGPRTADGKRRGATNTVVSADDDWILFTFDRGDGATPLEGVSGPGDSGGPALLERDGRLYTLGVSVFSDGGGKGPGRYGVREGYTRVSTHRDWIESVVSGASADRELAIGAGGGRETAVAASGAPGALPDSPVGALVARYVETYNRGDSEAMSAFIAEHFDEGFRASRPLEEHLALYRRLYDEHFGALTVQQVVGHSDSGLVVLFRSAKGPMAELGFETAPGEPKRIAGLRIAVVELGPGQLDGPRF